MTLKDKIFTMDPIVCRSEDDACDLVDKLAMLGYQPPVEVPMDQNFFVLLYQQENGMMVSKCIIFDNTESLSLELAGVGQSFTDISNN